MRACSGLLGKPTKDLGICKQHAGAQRRGTLEGHVSGLQNFVNGRRQLSLRRLGV